eukprot:1047668-Prorocentrum_minimum.AAC.1
MEKALPNGDGSSPVPPPFSADPPPGPIRRSTRGYILTTDQSLLRYNASAVAVANSILASEHCTAAAAERETRKLLAQG